METQTLNVLILKYMQYCSVIRNYKKLTIGGYKSTFSVFLRETGVTYPHELNKAIIENWFYKGRLEKN